MNIPNYKLLLFSFLTLFIYSCNTTQQEIATDTSNLVAELPVFNNYQTSILDHGAINDGKTLITEPVAKAIKTCVKAGGGKVTIPRGLWISGPIELKSNVNLHLEEGAVVMFSKNLDDYPLIKSNFEGRDEVRAMPLIYANGADNIAITGKGIFDGSGQIWRPVKRDKVTGSQWKRIVNGGGVVDEEHNMWYPNEGAMEAAHNPSLARSTSIMEGKNKYKAYLRPPLVNIVNCNKVLFDGPTFQNSPGWCIHPLLSKNLTFVNINVRNPWNAQNGDGIDVESCRYVLIENSTLDVGDDALCLKSGRNEEGRKRGVPTEDVVIKNCIVYHGHGGFVVGSEMSGGVRNIKITDCAFMGTDVGLRFKSNRERGGVVENIEISNIYMVDILTNAIGFNLYYNGLSVVEQNELGEDVKINKFQVTEATPQFKNITIKDIVCNGAHTAIFINGLPEMPIENMTLNNIHIKSKNGAIISYAKSLTFEDVIIDSESENEFEFFDVSNVTMKASGDKQITEAKIKISGSESKDYEINYTNKPLIIVTDDVNPNEIKLD